MDMKRYFILILFFFCTSFFEELNCFKDGNTGRLNDEANTKENDASCLGFLCRDNSCIPSELRCNGVLDCLDHSDEESCPTRDSVPRATWTLRCQPNADGLGCSCADGYQLSQEDNKTCTDIDECSQTGFCSQMCINLPGSYKCSCAKGYQLVNRTCRALGPEPLLIFSTVREIFAMSLRSKMLFPVRKAIYEAWSLTTDYSKSRIYWTEKSNASTMYSSNMDGSGLEVVLKNGLISPEEIAVDYIAGNLYLADAGLRQILVCKMDGSMCHALHSSELYDHSSVVLDLHKRLMYWSVQGESTAGIYRSGMDGSQPVRLVSTDIVWPNSLALDHTTNRLYWVEVNPPKIEYISLDDGTRKVLVNDIIKHPYSLAVFEDNLYWSDFYHLSLDTYNKFTGKQMRLVTKKYQSSLVIGVHVHHPVLAVRAKNPCLDNPCSHLCLMAPLDGYTCACPHGFNLTADGRNCTVNSDFPILFVNDASRIYHIRPEAVGNMSMEQVPFTQVDRIGKLAYDWKSKYLYISDMSKPGIFALNMTTMVGEYLVRNDSMRVEDMAYDWLSGNLYWLDSHNGTAEVFSTITSRAATILEVPDPRLSKLTALALLPTLGVMFVATNGENPSLSMYDMDGTKQQIFDNVKGNISALAVNPTESLLYFAVPEERTISSINFSDPKGIPTIVASELSSIVSLAVNGKYLYWTDSHRSLLHFKLHSFDAFNQFYINLTRNENGHSSMKVTYAAATSNSNLDHVSCMSSNECSYLCVSTPKGGKCICPDGMQLTSDNRTCVEKEVRCPIDDFRCQNGRCILPAWKCDTRDDCGDGSDEVDCPIDSSCTKDQHLCRDGTCIPKLWRCDGEKDCVDGSDEVGCHSTSCSDIQFRCGSGQCIPQAWTCDGTEDCTDGLDETICRERCSSSEFQCDNYGCILNTLVCDNKEDCTDGSDEKNCTKSCRKGQYSCNAGTTCIYDHEVCDGHIDCLKGDDELNCPIEKCKPEEHLCANPRRCIPKRWICDGDADCIDGSDEQNCTQNFKPTYPPPASGCDGFFCRFTGRCVAWSKVCDGRDDCGDMMDEVGKCDIECTSDVSNCSQLCQKTPEGPRCLCHEGYNLAKDGVGCEDINECDIHGTCSQFCNNTKGGFVCSCTEGYNQEGSGICRANLEPATLIYMSRDRIVGVELSGDSYSRQVYFTDYQADMRGMDYDAAERIIFWTDWIRGTVNSYDLKTDTQNILLTTTAKATRVQWDWINKNLLYANDYESILSCSQDGTLCSTIFNAGSDVLNSFRIAPLKGLIFAVVTRPGFRAGEIERFEMDGSHRMVIISECLPTSLAVDHIMDRLYWTEMDRVESSDFHGLTRRRIVEKSHQFYMAITLFEDDVFLSEWSTDSLVRCDKRHGGNCREFQRGSGKPDILLIANLALQPKGVNRCLNNECPQLCLPNRSGHVCKCDDNYDLVNGACEIKPKTLSDEEKFVLFLEEQFTRLTRNSTT